MVRSCIANSRLGKWLSFLAMVKLLYDFRQGLFRPPAVPRCRRAALRGARRRLMQEIRDTFAAEDWDGLRQSHFRLLSNVPRETASASPTSAMRLGMTKQASGQFVTQLIGTGHLEARADPHDGRVRVVVRTALGDCDGQGVQRAHPADRTLVGKVVGPERYAEFRRCCRSSPGQVTAPLPTARGHVGGRARCWRMTATTPPRCPRPCPRARPAGRG